MRKRKELRPRTPGSLKKYGLTVEQWQELLAEGDGRCWICGKGGLKKHLSVDHDHTLEKLGVMRVRGLLCQRCNRSIGAFEWSDEVIEKAIKYLSRISLTRSEARAILATDTDNRVPSGRNQKGA